MYFPIAIINCFQFTWEVKPYRCKAISNLDVNIPKPGPKGGNVARSNILLFINHSFAVEEGYYNSRMHMPRTARKRLEFGFLSSNLGN